MMAIPRLPVAALNFLTDIHNLFSESFYFMYYFGVYAPQQLGIMQ